VITVIKFFGVLAFAATPASRAWRGEPRESSHWLGALTTPGMRTAISADVPFGALFGLLDVAVPAFAKAHGSPALAGLLLAALAVGSMIGGVIYGSRPRKVSGVRYAQLCTLQAVMTVPLVFSDSTLALGLSMGIAGLTVAAISTVSFGLLDIVAPPGTDTEASAWVLTAYQLGLAAGTAAGGLIVDGPGTRVAFAIAAGCAALSAAVLWVRRRTMEGHGIKAVGIVAPAPATAIDP
jgi:predicted MFS family arabinose efflux permease